jgi:hypothetical protein
LAGEGAAAAAKAAFCCTKGAETGAIAIGLLVVAVRGSVLFTGGIKPVVKSLAEFELKSIIRHISRMSRTIY